MARMITVSEFAAARQDGKPLAAIDVREPAEYNLAHIPGVFSLPRRRLEFQARSFIPYLDTRVVVVDDDGRRSALAAATLEAMGYTDVSVLQGGANRWAAEDMPTEWGVNVPSKAFGERVLHGGGVQEITADELQQWQERGEAFVLVDTRTPEEHRRMCIPGSRSLPNAELGLRIWELRDGEETPIVVHCAGRTRSIIGAATLLRMGARNVYALKNGTSGWRLAGYELEYGSNRLELPDPAAEHLVEAEERARQIAAEDGVRLLRIADLPTLAAEGTTRNVYFFDVRTREEYEAGHIPGFAWAPGGQLVQATDSYIGVNASLVVLACDGVTRSAMTGSWLRQMGFADVVVIDGGVNAWAAAGQALTSGAEAPQPFGLEAARQQLTLLTPAELVAQITARASTILFVGGSDEFAAGHIPGSRWLPRGYLELRIGEAAPSKQQPLVVSCTDGLNAALAGAALRSLGYEDVSLLDGGIAAWNAAGYDLEKGLSGITLAPDDVLPPSRSFADMMNYLRWEEDMGQRALSGHDKTTQG